MVLALCLGLAAVGLLATALFLWLQTQVPDYAAALILAGTFLVGAGVALWVTLAGADRERAPVATGTQPPGPASDLEHAMRLAEDVLPNIRRRPVRSMLLALAVGVGVGLFFEKPPQADDDDAH